MGIHKQRCLIALQLSEELKELEERWWYETDNRKNDAIEGVHEAYEPKHVMKVTKQIARLRPSDGSIHKCFISAEFPCWRRC